MQCECLAKGLGNMHSGWLSLMLGQSVRATLGMGIESIIVDTVYVKFSQGFLFCKIVKKLTPRIFHSFKFRCVPRSQTRYRFMVFIFANAD